MIVVISCAGSKSERAGRLKTRDGTPIEFVAQPDIAPRRPGVAYERPDGDSGCGVTWRRWLVEYNQKHVGRANNPDGLLPAWQLYKPPIYGQLVNKYGQENIFILSAGWGLIRSDFLTPAYDITFSNQADEYKKRMYEKDKFSDYNALRQPEVEIKGPIVFLGGKSYVDLFCKLTEALGCRKVVFYKGYRPSVPPGYEPKAYSTKTNTNWHYLCAQDLIAGKIQI